MCIWLQYTHEILFSNIFLATNKNDFSEKWVFKKTPDIYEVNKF